MTKQPKVTLINFTQDPIETMCWTRRVMHSPVPDTLQELKDDPIKWLGMSINKYVDEVLMQDGMPTFLEYISLVFKLENVSRAFQQHLTRHRIGFSYSIQSLRCVDLPNFAVDGAYYNPYEEKTDKYFHYNYLMNEIQKKYREALNYGMPTQDARGLLPMNVYSTITFSCSLRALVGMVNKRLCSKTQGEFRRIAAMIMTEIKEKMDPRILNWIGSPCSFGKCMMKGENEQQLKENKLSGKQNTDHICPIYYKKFVGKNE